jgi:hypothetical protein
VRTARSCAPSAPAADHRIPADNVGFSIPEEDCGFAIDSLTLRVTGKLIASFTNTEAEKTIVRNVGGPGLLTLGEDGGVFDSQGHGFTWLSPTEQAPTGLPSLAFTVGHFVVPVNADIEAIGASLRGYYVDGCALLA